MNESFIILQFAWFSLPARFKFKLQPFESFINLKVLKLIKTFSACILKYIL